MKRFLAALIAAALLSSPLVAPLAVPAWAQTKMVIATGVDPAFSQFYVAKEAGIFAKNGLDVSINTGPSGSAMVPFLINDQINAAYGSDLAGVINHNIDPKIVAVADGTLLVKWESVISRNAADFNELKGKKFGVPKGTSAEMFWIGVMTKFNLTPSDYTVVDIEAPEMVAALERGDINAFAVWEPWPTRALMSIKGAKILADNEDIIQNRNFVYMNRGWIEQNRDTATRFVRSLCEANDLINSDRPAATKMVAKFLNMPLPLATELMPKVEYDMFWTDGSLHTIKESENFLVTRGKMKAPLDYADYVYTDLLKAVRPETIRITKLPPD